MQQEIKIRQFAFDWLLPTAEWYFWDWKFEALFSTFKTGVQDLIHDLQEEPTKKNLEILENDEFNNFQK